MELTDGKHRKGGKEGMEVARGKATRSDTTGAARSVGGVDAAWRLGQFTAESVSGSANNGAKLQRARRCVA